MKLSIEYKPSEIMQWLVVVGIFMERWFEIVILLIINLMIFAINKRLVLSKGIFYTLFFVALYSLSSITYVGYGYDKFLQQLGMLAFMFVGYYNLFSFINFDAKAIFDKYLKVAYIVCCLALFQFVFFAIAGIDPFSFISGRSPDEILPHVMRLNSIFVEPSELSSFTTPLLVYIILKGKENNFSIVQKLIVFISVFLTFSTITFVVIILLLLYKYLFYIRQIWIRIIALVATFFIIFYISTVNIREQTSDNALGGIFMKIDDTFGAFSKMDPQSFEVLNLSTYATMTNIWVAQNAPLRLTGTGLGTHSANYESLYQSDFSYYGLNKEDGYALFNRLFSEFGIIGLLVVVVFLLKRFNKKNVINISIAFLLLTLMMRGGHYTRYGLILYLFIYYYTGKNNAKEDNCSISR